MATPSLPQAKIVTFDEQSVVHSLVAKGIIGAPVRWSVLQKENYVKDRNAASSHRTARKKTYRLPFSWLHKRKSTTVIGARASEINAPAARKVSQSTTISLPPPVNGLPSAGTSAESQLPRLTITNAELPQEAGASIAANPSRASTRAGQPQLRLPKPDLVSAPSAISSRYTATSVGSSLGAAQSSFSLPSGAITPMSESSSSSTSMISNRGPLVTPLPSVNAKGAHPLGSVIAPASSTGPFDGMFNARPQVYGRPAQMTRRWNQEDLHPHSLPPLSARIRTTSFDSLISIGPAIALAENLASEPMTSPPSSKPISDIIWRTSISADHDATTYDALSRAFHIPGSTRDISRMTFAYGLSDEDDPNMDVEITVYSSKMSSVNRMKSSFRPHNRSRTSPESPSCSSFVVLPKDWLSLVSLSIFAHFPESFDIFSFITAETPPSSLAPSRSTMASTSDRLRVNARCERDIEMADEIEGIQRSTNYFEAAVPAAFVIAVIAAGYFLTHGGALSFVQQPSV